MKPKKVVRENNTKIKQVFTSLSFSKADNMNFNLYNLYSWQTNAFVGISTLSLSWSGVTRKTCSHSKTEFATTCCWYSFSFLFSNQQLRRFFAFSAIQKRSKDFSRCAQSGSNVLILRQARVFFNKAHFRYSHPSKLLNEK